jgi:uncharacterized membrane protein
VNEFIETIRFNLDSIGELVEVVLNAISLILIVVGVIASFAKSIRERHRIPANHPRHTYFRMMFGGWLVVALEFQLAADIVGTIVSPTNAHLIQLGAVALIRTFLNYFLNKELNEQVEYSRTTIKKTEEKIV